MSDSYDSFFDRSHDDFFEGTAYTDFLFSSSAQRKPASHSHHVLPSSHGLTGNQDLANIQLPRPQQHPTSMSPHSVTPMTGFMRNVGPRTFSAPSSHHNNPFHNQQVTGAGSNFVCQQQTAAHPAWQPQVHHVLHPQQQEHTRPDFLARPTSSHGASHSPMPITASTPQRFDHPGLIQATTNAFPSFNNTANIANPPPQPNLPTLPPIDGRASLVNAANRQLDTDDFLLDQLVTRDFSSPSIPSATPRPTFNNFPNPLPQLVNPPRSLRDYSTQARDVRGVLGGESDSANSDSFQTALSNMSSRPRRGGRGSGVSLITLPELPAAASSSSSTPTGPRTSKTPQISPALKGSGSGSKRKRSVDDDPKLLSSEADDIINLVDKEEVPEAIRKPKKYTRLRDFTCIICYEEVTDLTVTFCGHMFCAGCLHSALTVDPSRRVCPVCRQKVDKEPLNGSFGPRAKGYFPLQLKLKSRKEMDKQRSSR